MYIWLYNRVTSDLFMPVSPELKNESIAHLIYREHF